jgi:hypothetical protein
MQATGEPLGKVGFETLTTKSIRARRTPLLLYRYFRDKCEVLKGLARRLAQEAQCCPRCLIREGGAAPRQIGPTVLQLWKIGSAHARDSLPANREPSGRCEHRHTLPILGSSSSVNRPTCYQDLPPHAPCHTPTSSQVQRARHRLIWIHHR